MLPRSKRLSVPLFTNVLANGKIVHSALLSARILKTAGTSRFSAVVSKKVSKTAVGRNALRRRVYAAVGQIESRLKDGFHVVLMVKPTILKVPLKNIVADLKDLFVKSALVK